MPFREHAPDDGRGLARDVAIDQEEGGAHAFAREHVEQIRRRRRVGSVVERQIHGRRRRARHVPHGAVPGHLVEEERAWRRVGQHEHADAEDRNNPHPRESRAA